MNGYRSKIFELHDLPGGLCTAWQRGEYIFDGCIHYLYGSGQGKPFNRIWQELGALQNVPVIDHDEFMRVRGTDSRTFVVYCDPDRLERHIADLSPADAKLGRALASGIRKFMKFDMSLLRETPQGVMDPLSFLRMGVRMMPYLGALLRWGPVSAAEFAARFEDPLLREAFKLIFAWESIPMMAGLMQLAYMQVGNAGFPSGGSLEFARRVERRYLELGGEVYYKAQVEKILIEGQRVVGLRLYNDEVHRADIVISAADGRMTIFDLLGERFVDGKIRRLYNGHLPIHSQVQVSLGVNRDLSRELHWVTYLLDEPVLIAGLDRHYLGVKHYCFDPVLTPAGKSSVVIMLESNYGYWQHIYGRKLYDTEQTQVAEIVIDLLERWYPGISEEIEVVDVATPLSYERYTRNWLGSTCGWLLTKKTMAMNITGVRKTVPGLENFYMCGQWVEPGGTLSLAALSARNVIKMICRKDGKPFVTRVD